MLFDWKCDVLALLPRHDGLWTLELWAKINTLSIKLLLSECFVWQQEKKLKQVTTYLQLMAIQDEERNLIRTKPMSVSSHSGVWSPRANRISESALLSSMVLLPTVTLLVWFWIRVSLTMEPWMTWNSPWRADWPQSYRFVCLWVLGLKMCDTMHTYNVCALYLLSDSPLSVS